MRATNRPNQCGGGSARRSFLPLLSLCLACPGPALQDGGAVADGGSIDRAVEDDASRPDRGEADRGGGDTDRGDASRDDASRDDATAPDLSYDPSEVVGQIRVQEREGGEVPRSNVGAVMLDGPSLDLAPERWFALEGAADGCELYSAAFLGDFGMVCDPECSYTDEFCSPDLTCERLPQFAPAGDIVVSGLTLAVTLEPRIYDYDYAGEFPGGDAVAPGAAVTATAAGGSTEAFTLQAFGVSDLEVASRDLTVTEGEDLEVRWTPQGDGTIEIYLTPWVHAFTYMYIRCRVADDGLHQVPWALLERFPYDEECGRGECWSRAHVARFTQDAVHTANGVVLLRVESIEGVNLFKPRP